MKIKGNECEAAEEKVFRSSADRGDSEDASFEFVFVMLILIICHKAYPRLSKIPYLHYAYYILIHLGEYYMIYQLTRSVITLYFKLYHELSVSGKEKASKERPIIIASNHASYLDPPVVGFLLSEQQICCLGEAF